MICQNERAQHISLGVCAQGIFHFHFLRKRKFILTLIQKGHYFYSPSKVKKLKINYIFKLTATRY
jgi:hypothetical protein